MMKAFMACVAFVCVAPAACAAAELKGTVRSRSGGPLAGVLVMSRCRGVAETDAAGSFKLRAPSLSDCGRVVFFWAEGFVPQIKVVGSSAESVHAVLEESAGRARDVMTCRGSRDDVRRLGWMLRVPVTEGASVERSRGAHGSGYRLRVRGEKRRVGLDGYGGQYAHGYPNDDLILSAAGYTIRPWRSGREEGVDFRGRAADGTRWRYFAVMGEGIGYGGVTEDEACALDRIIDGACFQPPSKPAASRPVNSKGKS